MNASAWELLARAAQLSLELNALALLAAWTLFCIFVGAVALDVIRK